MSVVLARLASCKGPSTPKRSSPIGGRYFENRLYEDIMYEAFEDGAMWLQAPRPKLHDDLYQFEDIIGKPTLLDHEIIFDAPNIVRVGKDLLYQVSNSGNMKGYKWLKRFLEPMGYKLHYSELYSFAHFDSTIIPLRPGLVLLNSARVTPDNCPEMFKSWDKIYFDDCVTRGNAIEGYPDFYNRKEIDTTQGKVWMYFIPDVAGYNRKPVHGDVAEWNSETSISWR